jgi:hypothetical protein
VTADVDHGTSGGLLEVVAEVVAELVGAGMDDTWLVG